MALFAPPFAVTIRLTPEQRVKARRRVKDLVARERRTWVAVALMTVLITAGGVFGPMVARSLSGSGLPLIVAILVVNLTVVGGTLATVFLVIHRVRTRAYRQAVRELGFPVCVGCGYVFQGHDGSVVRCPECGDVSERLALEKPPDQRN